MHMIKQGKRFHCNFKTRCAAAALLCLWWPKKLVDVHLSVAFSDSNLVTERDNSRRKPLIIVFLSLQENSAFKFHHLRKERVKYWIAFVWGIKTQQEFAEVLMLCKYRDIF